MSINVLLFGHYGRKNLGDDAMLLGIIKELELLDIDLNIRVLSTSDKAEFYYNYPDNKNISFYRRSFYSTIKNLLWGNIFILGGGTYFQDFKENKRFTINMIFFLFFTFFIKLLKKRIIYLGIGIGPLSTNAGKWLIKKLLTFSDLIIVREKKSFKIAENMLKQNSKKVSIGFDPAVSVISKYHKICNYSIPPKIIGCSIHPYFKIYELKDVFDDKIIDTIVSAVEPWLNENKEREFRIFIIRDTQYGGDTQISKRLFSCFKNNGQVKVKKYINKPKQTLEEIKKCDAFITMRLHSLIFSFLAQIPFLVISYHPKCLAIVEELGLSEEGIILIKDALDKRLFKNKFNKLCLEPRNFVPKLSLEEARIRKNKMYNHIKYFLRDRNDDI